MGRIDRPARTLKRTTGDGPGCYCGRSPRSMTSPARPEATGTLGPDSGAWHTTTPECRNILHMCRQLSRSTTARAPRRRPERPFLCHLRGRGHKSCRVGCRQRQFCRENLHSSAASIHRKTLSHCFYWNIKNWPHYCLLWADVCLDCPPEISPRIRTIAVFFTRGLCTGLSRRS